VLSEYRRYLKTVRDRSGHILGEKPALKAIAEKVRQITQEALGNRCYLEGDWRGETPRNGGVL